MTKAYQNYLDKNAGILAAAERLFLMNGYGNTSMDAIAREAKVTKQTVYRYFPSKGSLFKALLQQTSAQIELFVFTDQPAQEELYRYAQEFVITHMKEKHIWMYRLMLCESGKHHEISDIFNHQSKRVWRTVLCEFLRDQWQLSDAETYAAMFNTMLLYQRHEIIMGLKPIPDEQQLRQQSRQVSDLFYHGLIHSLTTPDHESDERY